MGRMERGMRKGGRRKVRGSLRDLGWVKTMKANVQERQGSRKAEGGKVETVQIQGAQAVPGTKGRA